jgi:hypothetical protein
MLDPIDIEKKLFETKKDFIKKEEKHVKLNA